MSAKSGMIKVRLLNGVTLSVAHPGPLPSILMLEADGDSDRGARVPCRRVDVERYLQMTVEEMLEAGLLRAKAGTRGSAEPGGPAEP